MGRSGDGFEKLPVGRNVGPWKPWTVAGFGPTGSGRKAYGGEGCASFLHKKKKRPAGLVFCGRRMAKDSVDVVGVPEISDLRLVWLIIACHDVIGKKFRFLAEKTTARSTLCT